MLHGFHRFIVDINSNDPDIRRAGSGVNGKTMVLGSNIDFIIFEIFYRLVGTTMSEFKFVSPGAESQSQDLMAQADAEQGILFRESPDGRHGLFDDRRMGWVAGPVRNQNTIRFEFIYLGRPNIVRHPDNGAVTENQLPDNVFFDSAIDQNYLRSVFVLINDLSFGGGDFGYQVIFFRRPHPFN